MPFQHINVPLHLCKHILFQAHNKLIQIDILFNNLNKAVCFAMHRRASLVKYCWWIGIRRRIQRNAAVDVRFRRISMYTSLFTYCSMQLDDWLYQLFIYQHTHLYNALMAFVQVKDASNVSATSDRHIILYYRQYSSLPILNVYVLAYKLGGPLTKAKRNWK